MDPRYDSFMSVFIPQVFFTVREICFLRVILLTFIFVFLSGLLIVLLICYFRIHVVIRSYINKDLPAFVKLLLHSSVRLLVTEPVAYATKADYERYRTFCIVIISSTNLN
jgi:1-acyl-sn-glycerol-3-phosphate acyltransferase